MAIQVNITTTNYLVSATETNNVITFVADSSTYSINNLVSVFTVTTVSPEITFNTDGMAFATGYVSTLTVGTFSATLATVADLTVTNTLKFGPLYYPNVSGEYGQVLFTDGDQYANWVNLGDLTIWSLSEDLKTNGFDITTYGPTNLKIQAASPAGQSYAYVDINYQGTTQGGIRYDSGAGNHIFQNGNASFGLDISVSGDITANSNVYVGSLISGSDSNQPLGIASGGLRFSDGSVMTTAGTGSFNVSQIASASSLGVVRVGSGLSITVDGILSSTYSYTLPTASTSVKGGVKIGNGLEMAGEFLNVTTSTEYGNVSLTQVMRTNGYAIKETTSSQNFLELSGSARLGYSSNYFQASANQLLLQNSSGSLSLVSSQPISLASSATIVGTDATTSRIQVQKIYNYLGTYAPEFPAGLQYGDGSVQVTAWQTTTLIQSSITVDFDNPFDP